MNFTQQEGVTHIILVLHMKQLRCRVVQRLRTQQSDCRSPALIHYSSYRWRGGLFEGRSKFRISLRIPVPSTPHPSISSRGHPEDQGHILSVISLLPSILSLQTFQILAPGFTFIFSHPSSWPLPSLPFNFLLFHPGQLCLRSLVPRAHQCGPEH